MKADKQLPGFSAEENVLIDKEYQALITDYLNSPHRQKTEIIERAFVLARLAHGAVRRRSGEPYILHPLAVARIVCKEIGLGSTSICCALLHDIVEDTDYTVEDIHRQFGEKIARIVEGLTKISGEKLTNQAASLQAQNIRKLLLTIGDDARVIVIKLADRLHNMRTLDSMRQDKQLKIAGETSFFYAPLADRLGLYAIKIELEDLSFRYEHPDAYREIQRKVIESEAGRHNLFMRFSAPIKDYFTSRGINYEMKARVKSNYSIWRKMQLKGIPFEEVYDLFAVRVIFDSQDGYPEKNRCWDIYTAITDIYRSRPDRLRDWISAPKSNGYQALHLTVLGPDAQWIEVQIRSRRMDEIAEKGLAAHWKYKENKVEEDKDLEVWLDTIREVLNHPDSNGMDFLDTVHLSLYTHDITLFTPKGDTITLPAQATVLDFAYAIHSELGDRCIGAKVNHQVVPISFTLSNGDQVEILHSKSVQPMHQWLEFATTAKAKMRIEVTLRKQQREYMSRGEELVSDLLLKVGKNIDAATLLRLARHYGLESRDELFYNVGNGTIELDEDPKKLLEQGTPPKSGRLSRVIASVFGSKSKEAPPQSKSPTPQTIDRRKPYELREINGHLNYILASCCKPIAGDDTLGVLDDKGQVIVHKSSCPWANKLKTLHGERLVSVAWGEHFTPVFEATIIFRGIDTMGILNAITQSLFEDFRVSITEIHITTKDGVFTGTISLRVLHTSDVQSICLMLQRNSAIHEAYRLSEIEPKGR